jgi:hypothetical protein
MGDALVVEGDSLADVHVRVSHRLVDKIPSAARGGDSAAAERAVRVVGARAEGEPARQHLVHTILE